MTFKAKTLLESLWTARITREKLPLPMSDAEIAKSSYVGVETGTRHEMDAAPAGSKLLPYLGMVNARRTLSPEKKLN